MSQNNGNAQLIAEGESFLQANEWAQAAAAFSKALEANPAERAAVNGLVRALVPQRDFVRAEATLSRALANELDDADYLQALAGVYEEQQQYEKAFDTYVKLDNVQLVAALLTRLRTDKKFAEAEQLSGKALTRFSNALSILLERAQLFIDQEQYAPAIPYIDRVILEMQGNPAGLYLKVWLHRMLARAGEAGQLDEAEKVLTAALAAHQDDKPLRSERCWIQFDRKEYEQAFDCAWQVGDTSVPAEMIKDLREAGNTADAQKFLQESLTRFPTDPLLITEQGWLQVLQEQYDAALDSFIVAGNDDAAADMFSDLLLKQPGADADPLLEKALLHFPQNFRLHYARAVRFLEQEKYAECVKDFDAVLAPAPQRILMLPFKTKALRTLGRAGDIARFAEAQQALDEALALSPDAFELLKERGWLEYDTRRYEAAFATFAEIKDFEAMGSVINAVGLQGNTAEATKMVNEALKLSPDQPEILVTYGALLYDQREYEKAAEQFDKVLKSNDSNEFALQWMMASLRMQGRDGKSEKFAEAEQLMEKTLARFPNHEDFLIERGWLSFEQERFAEADAAFAKAAKLAADPRQANFGRIEALTRNKRGDEVAKIIDSLKQTYPTDPDVLLKAGSYYIERNDLDNAKKEFESILKIDPKNAWGINGLASIQFMKGEFEEAEKMFREALALAENDPTFHTNLAWALVRQDKEDDFAEAEKSCRRALEIFPNYGSAFGCLGVIAFRRGRISESEDYLLASTRASARDGNYTDLGALYVQMARYEEAEAKLKTALDINPYDTQAFIQRGNLYLAQQKTKEAVREFRRAMVIDKWSEEAARMLATALMSAGEYGEAERVLRDAIKRLNENRRWQLHLRLSELLVSLGDEKKDEQYYEDALAQAAVAKRLNCTHADPYFHEGIVLAKLRHYSGARNSFKQCVKIKDDHYDAQRNLYLVKSKITEERALNWVSKIGAAIVGGSAAAQLIALWVIYLKTSRVSETMLTVMIPILLGLIVISLLLPVLVKLKLPGLEAELNQSQQKEPLSSGPKGEIGFGGSSSITSPKAR